MRGCVLIVAGSDSSGGAGIQADIKSVTALGGYSATAITALTAQNTLGVHGIVAIEPGFVAQQMDVVLSDIGIDCIKTGMLHNAEIVDAVADVLDRAAPDTPLVVDPVMVAKGGQALLDEEARAALKRRLLHRATIITPNILELSALCGGEPVKNTDDLQRVAHTLCSVGARAVLAKGGHLDGEYVRDVLVNADGGVEIFESERIDTIHTHGTGCSLASGIATGLAQGLNLSDSVLRAREFVRRAIIAAPGLGAGRGPLDHTVTVQPLARINQ